MRSIKEQIAIAEAAKKVVMMSDTEKQINFEVRPTWSVVRAAALGSHDFARQERCAALSVRHLAETPQVLEMIPNSRIPLPLKGIVTSRYTEKMLAEETMRRKAAGTTKPVRNQ